MGIYHITYAPEPRELCIYFDGPCNFSCHGCICRNRPLDVHLAERSEEVRSSISAEEVLRLVEELDFRRVIFMGFEPTVNREFYKLAKTMKLRFSSYNVLLTNGYEFAESEVVDSVSVSIKAITEEIFTRFTGKRESRRVLQNFRRYRDLGLELRAESILVPDLIDADEIERIAEFIAEVDPRIPYRIDGYIPMENDVYRRPTVAELEEARRRAEKYLRDVSILHHGMKPKYAVRRIY